MCHTVSHAFSLCHSQGLIPQPIVSPVQCSVSYFQPCMSSLFLESHIESKCDLAICLSVRLDGKSIPIWSFWYHLLNLFHYSQSFHFRWRLILDLTRTASKSASSTMMASTAWPTTPRCKMTSRWLGAAIRSPIILPMTAWLWVT